jgi:hypothetical protein
MSKIKGKNAVFSLLVGVTYYPVYCCKTWELVQIQEEIEVTSVNSGSDREYEPGMSSSTVECTGVATLDNTGGIISPTYLQQQAVRRLNQSWRITLTDDDSNVLVYSFDGIITKTGISKQTGSYLGASLSVRVTGALSPNVIILPPVPTNEFVLYIDGVAGQWTVSHADLDGATILGVARSGMVHEQVSGTPVAGGSEFKYIDGAGTGTIEFDSNQPFNAGPPLENVWILFKK